MDYTNMGYQQMLQVLQQARTCRVAAAAGGAPCLVPVCCSFYMDGCTPVMELHCQGEEELLAALAQNPMVTIEAQRGTRAGVECVLLQGQAVTVQPEGGCHSCPQRWSCRQCCTQRPAVVRVMADTLTGRCLRECPESCGRGY